MLNSIKAIINEKHSFTEAAALILENDQLDDSIILDESPEDEPTFEPAEETPAENPMPLPGNDDLPEPIGKQTGEPAEIAASDILGVEIDLATNTQTDTLPIPPANANDAIADNDDIMSQHVDAGFGDEPAPAGSNDILDEPIDDEPEKNEETDPVDLMDEPMDEYTSLLSGRKPKEDEKDKKDDNKNKDDEENIDEYTSLLSGREPKNGEKKDDKSKNKDATPSDKKDDDPLTEAITIGDTPAEDNPADGGAGDGGDAADAPAEGGDDNLINAAVKDKVDELTADAPAPTEDPQTTKDALLKKLSSITKSLEDAKKAVMDSIR